MLPASLTLARGGHVRIYAGEPVTTKYLQTKLVL